MCRYGPDGWLEQSDSCCRRRTARRPWEALAAAPLRQDHEGCPGHPDRYPQVVFTGGTDLGSVRVVSDSECPEGHGVFFSGIVRELTEDVMFWALSPGWSGSVSGDVPLPEGLRR